MRSTKDPHAVVKNGTDEAVAGGTANVRVAANADEFHVVDAVHWSFSASPIGGNMQIQFGSVLKFYIGCVDAGDHTLTFPRGFYEGTKNEQLDVYVTGGVGVVPKVNVLYR